MCSSDSKLFKGPCVREHNCLSTCEREGFDDGRCEGVRRKCICFKRCSGTSTTNSETANAKVDRDQKPN